MGLDMFLFGKTFVGIDERTKMKLDGVEGIDPSRVEFITEELGYWRKANAIHRWFVENVQGGNDDCKDYWVPREKLQELLDTVNTVLEASELVEGKVQNGTQYRDGKAEPIIEDGKYIKNPGMAEALLPTQSGFFFGGTDYDQYYYEDLVRTKEILTEALDPKHNGKSIYYGSSW